MFLTSKRRTMLCSVAVLVISVAGCSKSKDQATSTGDTTPPASLSGKVNDHGTTDLTGAGGTPTTEMELDDNYFGPTFLEVAPGATVQLELRNEGSRQHTVTTAGVDVVVDPGQAGEAELTAPASGQLDFYCRFHKNTGMQGSVVVTSAAAGGAGGASSSTSASSSSTSTTKASSGGYGY